MVDGYSGGHLLPWDTAAPWFDTVAGQPDCNRPGAGGDYLDGRLWFASGSHLYSYRLP
jgi:hypothetical protein